jgi:hypothetical protein
MEKNHIAAAQDATDAVDAPLWRSPSYTVGIKAGSNGSLSLWCKTLSKRILGEIHNRRMVMSRNQRMRKEVRAEDASVVDEEDDAVLRRINKPCFTLRQQKFTACSAHQGDTWYVVEVRIISRQVEVSAVLRASRTLRQANLNSTRALPVTKYQQMNRFRSPATALSTHFSCSTRLQAFVKNTCCFLSYVLTTNAF